MRVALTGGATGIGAAVVQKLTAAGHSVVAFDIQEPETEVAQWVRTDLSDPVSIAEALRQVQGPFDALLNNAGLPPREGLASKILQVNFLGFRAFLNGMLDHLAPGASIVNTASRAGAMWQQNLEQVQALMALDRFDAVAGFLQEQAIDDTRAYNLSKEAVIVHTLGQCEAMLARGLRMNCVSPAAVSTGILGDFTRAFGPRVTANIARAGRAGTPEEIADVILFLASPESGWIKGVDLTIDGGMSAMALSDALGLNA